MDALVAQLAGKTYSGRGIQVAWGEVAGRQVPRANVEWDNSAVGGSFLNLDETRFLCFYGTNDKDLGSKAWAELRK